jgi:hypothetical protein
VGQVVVNSSSALHLISGNNFLILVTGSRSGTLTSGFSLAAKGISVNLICS